MKITKEQGAACLMAMKAGENAPWRSGILRDALHEIGWGQGPAAWFDCPNPTGPAVNGQVQTALAMCAAIAGVRP